MAVSRGREAEGGSAREGWSAGEGGVGEANSVAKLPERRGVDGDLDGDARTMATLLERVLECFFIFLMMEYVLDILLELLAITWLAAAGIVPFLNAFSE